MQQLTIEQKNDIEVWNLMMRELELISRAANMAAGARMTYIAPTVLEALK